MQRSQRLSSGDGVRGRRSDATDGVAQALLHTLPGRAIVVGAAIKAAVLSVRAILGGVPAFLGVIETVASVAVVAGVVYFLFRLTVLAKRRLLWRVRRKLILSYIFVGFVPAILLAAFALCCGFLLFYNLSSYLVQARLKALGDQARYFAQTTALDIERAGARDAQEILARQQTRQAVLYPGISLAVVPVTRVCPGTKARLGLAVPGPVTAGPWPHVEPPRDVPRWVTCAGYSGVMAYTHRRNGASEETDTHMLIRAVAFPDAERPPYAVVVDLQVNEPIQAQLRRDTGVEIRRVTPTDREDPQTFPLAGRPGGDLGEAAPSMPGILTNLLTI